MNLKNVKSWSTGLIAAVAAVGMMSAASSEGATLIFDQVNNSGTVSYNGAGGALIGTNIAFETIQGVGTNNDVTIDCAGCVLNFTTGANISEGGPNGTTVFAGGGSISLTGGSILGGIANQTLVSGAFSGNVSVQFVAGTVMIVTGNGMDDKSDDLLNFFFNTPPDDFRFAETTVQIGGVAYDNATGGFSANLANGGNADFVNSTVPEPGTTMLLLLGMSGLVAARRRQS